MFKSRDSRAILFSIAGRTGYCTKESDALFNKSVSIITENDAYLLNGSDRYYSQGLFLQYSVAHQKKGRKNIRQVETGQKFLHQNENSTKMI